MNSKHQWGARSANQPATFQYQPKKAANNGKELQGTEEKESPTSIDGLIYVPNWISIDEEARIMKSIDSSVWGNDLRRRVQQFGYKFDYSSHHLDLRANIEPIPEYLTEIVNRLKGDTYFKYLPDQLIINEYEAGQGISPHRDKTYCFDETIASISMLSSVVMEFRHTKTLERKSILLEPRSLLIMTKDARYKWTHGINPLEYDIYNGVKYTRSRRVSLTFRNVIQEYVVQRKKELGIPTKQ